MAAGLTLTINPCERNIWGIYRGLSNGLLMCNKRFGRVCSWFQMLKPFFRLLRHLFFTVRSAYFVHDCREENRK